MTPFATFARPALLAFALSFLAGPSAAEDEDMFDAALKGDTGPVLAWIDSGGDLYVRDRSDKTLMHLAGWIGDIGLAQMLLDRGMDVDIFAPNDITPLMHASRAGQPEMVAFFLENGADPKHVADVGLTLLHMWALNGHPDTLTLLLDAGVDPLLAIHRPGHSSHGALPMDTLRANNHHQVLKTEPGRRFQRLTYEGTGCEGAIVRPRDTKLSLFAERVLGDASRWKEIAELNGLEGKGYRKGDCLALP